jgi:cation-transporting ATPase E
MEMPAGLTAADVRVRTARGEGNASSFRPSRTYWDIVNTNLFNLFNNILFVIGFASIALGQYNDAFTSVGQGLVNAIIGTVQDIIAKQKLDKIALSTRTKVRVVRDNTVQQVDPSLLVKDDVIHVQPGDQIVVDGTVLANGRLEMDESLLTGEADLVVKLPGDVLLSGSFCVNGEAYYVAERVGSASYANKLTDAVRMFQVVKTPYNAKFHLRCGW